MTDTFSYTDKIYRRNLNLCKPTEGFRIEGMLDKDLEAILSLSEKIFSEALGYEYPVLNLLIYSDIDLSWKAMIGDEIIGCYLLGEDSINSYEITPLEDLSAYQDRKGLHGVALGLLKEYRGLSYGRQLRNMPLLMGNYDYIWGGQAKTLNNLDNWTRHGRRLVGFEDENYITLMDLHY